MKRIGISDLSFYIPPLCIPVADIVRKRVREKPELERRLTRALAVTGQLSLHFPQPWEDAATMAAESIRKLLNQGQCRIDSLRYFATGSESSLDMSKPIASYVEGMLQRSGVPFPKTLSTFQVQHACAGGSLALLSIAALLLAQSDGDGGVVSCTDVARYKSHSTAELSQGAGAVSLYVTQNPKLLSLDLETVGSYSEDVDDFFRPIGSLTAEVQGRYSIDCYINAIEAAFLDYCRRGGVDPVEELKSTDLFVLHVPFPKMVYMGIHHLFSKFLQLGNGAILAELEKRGFSAITTVSAQVGNIYTGSIYLALRYLLADRYRELGEGIVGQKVLAFSYGSGNTMVVFRAEVCEEAPSVVENWTKVGTFQQTNADMEQYERWMQQQDAEPPIEAPSHHYYLSGIRDDGYREYAYGG